MAHALDPHRDTIFVFPWHKSIVTLAADCREAALRFVTESHRWDKAELAVWLINTATLFSRNGRAKDESKLDDLRNVDSTEFAALLEHTRKEVVLALDDGAARFAFRAIANGHIARCTDNDGVTGWAPQGTTRRLADRVLSLFAAAYLTRPSAAVGASSCACGSCGHVDLAPASRRPVLKDRTSRNTIPFFPDRA